MLFKCCVVIKCCWRKRCLSWSGLECAATRASLPPSLLSVVHNAFIGVCSDYSSDASRSPSSEKAVVARALTAAALFCCCGNDDSTFTAAVAAHMASLYSELVIAISRSPVWLLTVVLRKICGVQLVGFCEVEMGNRGEQEREGELQEKMGRMWPHHRRVVCLHARNSDRAPREAGVDHLAGA